MKIPTQDLSRQTAALRDPISQAWQRVLESGWFILGKEVQCFEEEFAKHLGAEYCITNGNGTEAIELALRAVGVKAGEEVVLAANAGMYGTVATLAIGASPIYCDIEENGFGLDPTLLSEKITVRTKAVILTHLYGAAADVRRILETCRSRGVALIEDCAECHGARVDGKTLGTWGDVGCFSFYPTKNLGALGDGGACITSHAATAATLKQLRQYGWSTRYHSAVPGGRNSRLDEVQAAVLRLKLPYLERWNARRRMIAQYYNRVLANSPLVTPEIGGDSYVGHLYVVKSRARDELRKKLSRMDIATDVHFPLPDYRQPSVIAQIGQPITLRNTEQSCATVLTLPCFPELSDAEVEHVAKATLQALRG